VNRSVRRVALVLGIAFAALVGQLSYVQVFSSERFAEHPANRRLLIKEYATRRGSIVAGAEVVAESRPTTDSLKYLRVYPQGPLFAHVSGYYSILFGRAGLEQSYNDELIGAGPEDVWEKMIDDFLGRDRVGDTLILTIDPALQRVAARALGRQRGAVAALDPETGEVLALYANPSFDPNPLSSHDLAAVRAAWDRLTADPAKPLLSRAAQERYPPGSTFKILVAAAALEAGISPDDTFPNPSSLALPLTDRRLQNFGGGACRGGSRISMAQGFRVSCNTTFAQIGMRLGPEKLEEMARRFGFGRPPAGFDLPAATSCLVAVPGGGCGPARLDPPQTAFSSIGQFSVRVTPLQMAMVAAAVANGGMLVRPHVVREIQDVTGRVIRRIDPAPEGRVVDPETAATLKRMMIDVVERGTGTPARVPGVEMGGKTGTAQTGVEGEAPHVWFVAFAPRIAVAVVVENGGDLADAATGGRVAGPIAKALIQARLGIRS
jgi:peptidoglycan glycosyltransferase